jgi:hypothetical protein
MFARCSFFAQLNQSLTSISHVDYSIHEARSFSFSAPPTDEAELSVDEGIFTSTSSSYFFNTL